MRTWLITCLAVPVLAGCASLSREEARPPVHPFEPHLYLASSTLAPLPEADWLEIRALFQKRQGFTLYYAMRVSLDTVEVNLLSYEDSDAGHNRGIVRKYQKVGDHWIEPPQRDMTWESETGPGWYGRQQPGRGSVRASPKHAAEPNAGR